MLDSPRSLSELISQIIYGYDEIKFLHEKSELIEKNVFSVQTTLENELKTSKAYNERTKLNIDDINEKLANAKVFFNEIESNQAEVKALFKSIDNLVIKEAALIKNVDSHITSYAELNAKNTELLNSFESIKNAIVLAAKTYENDAKLAITNLNDSLNKANSYINTLDVKEIKINNILTNIECAKTSCLQIANEIKEMRKRSQCLMSKADKIFEDIANIQKELDERIKQVDDLAKNYDIAFNKTNDLELQIKENMKILKEIFVLLDNKTLEQTLEEVKLVKTTLENATNIKDEINNTKSEIDTILVEQKTLLSNYITKEDANSSLVTMMALFNKQLNLEITLKKKGII